MGQVKSSIERVLFAAEELLVDELVEVEDSDDEDVLVKIEESEVELEVTDVTELIELEVDGGAELDDEEEDEDDELVVVVEDFEVTSTTPAAATIMITTTTIAMTTRETALPSTNFIEYLLPEDQPASATV